MQMKVAKYKLQVQSVTNDPSIQPLLHSPCMPWICTICPCRVLDFILFLFLGYSCSLNFLSVLLCPTTNLLSVRPKWLHLLVSIFSISCPQSSFCPACCSPSWLLASAQVGSLPWRVMMACNHCLHQFGGSSHGTWECIFLLILEGKWKWGSCVVTASASLCSDMKSEYVVYIQ